MKDTLKNLLDTPNKKMEINDKFLVGHVELKDDLDLIKLNLLSDSIEYQGIVMKKGLTYPIPKKGDTICAKTIYLKYNELFQFQVYIEGNVCDEKQEIKIEKVASVLSFEQNEIFNTLSNISNIKIDDDKSTIFIVENRFGNCAEVKSLSDSKIYSLEFEFDLYDKFKVKSFLWMNFHKFQNNKVIANKLTTFEFLNDEQMAQILNIIFFENLSIFKVIDINKEYIVVMNINYKVLNLNKKNDKLKVLNIELCELLIISNYRQENDEIKLFEESFIYKLNQKFHYLDIDINSKAILKLYILDYNIKGNKYDAIFIPQDNAKTIISNKEEYLIVNNAYPKIYEYFPCQIILLNTKNEKIKPVIFTIYAYNGLLNKINAFLNANCSKPYFYEFLYYNITQPLVEKEKKITVNNSEYNITIYDNFSSENRKRICILNIPYQNMKIQENLLFSNSIQVNELILNNDHEILCINDISSVVIKKPHLTSFFNQYYPYFGDIYDQIRICNANNLENIQKILNTKISKFNEIEFEYDINEINNFDDRLTQSQFKTWFGLIVCYYMGFFVTKQAKVLGNIVYLFTLIWKENLSYYDFIRIFSFLSKEIIINNNKATELIMVNKLDKFSPYLIAYQFNKELINDLHEYHPYFQAYLQFDSFEAYNYIHSQKSYTFSLEMIFMIKHQLLSAYEDFFFVKNKSSEEYAYVDCSTKITVVNEASIYEDNQKDIHKIDNMTEARNCAVPMVINFSHEKSGHFKFMIKNEETSSPVIYFKGLRILLEIFVSNDKYSGETGKIIENFICEDTKIIDELSTHFIYGELLQKLYFSGNENVLKDAVMKIFESNMNNNGEKGQGNLRLKKKNNNNKNIPDKKSSLELPCFRLYGCLMINENSIKKKAMIPKEKKEEIDKKNYNEKLDRYKKMKELYDKSKELFEKKKAKK